MLPAAMVPLGLRRDPAPAPGTRDDRPARGLEPRVDQRLAHREGGHRPRPMESRARDRLVGILLRHSEGRALILPPSSLPGWGRWGLNVLHCLGVPASSPTVERGGGDVRTDDTHAGDAVHLPTSSASADLVASRPQRFPLVRRTQSSPGPYSAKYPAANSFRVLKHQFSPRPPRRRLGVLARSRRCADSHVGSDSTQSSDGSANPPVILGTNPTEWPVMRPEPLLRIGGCVTWRARESYPFGSFQGVGNSEITLQYTPWGAQQRLLLWDHVFKLRRQLVARYGEWFRYVSLLLREAFFLGGEYVVGSRPLDACRAGHSFGGVCSEAKRASRTGKWRTLTSRNGDTSRRVLRGSASSTEACGRKDP